MQRIPIRLRMAALAALLALGAQPLAHAVEGSRQYTVKAGDSLGSISLALGVPVTRLISLNSLSDPDLILAGQTLQLPDDAGDAPPPSGAPARAAATREYTVRAGDSLSLIAASLGVSTSALISANQVADPDRLAVGQKLVVPGGPSATIAPAPARGAAAADGGPIGSLLDEAAARHKLDAALVKALAWYLSGWRPDAVSPAGALGVMQITSSAQEWVGQTLLKRAVDRAELRDNVDIGVAYLAYLITRQGDERQGLAAYLQGPASLTRIGLSPSTSRALETIYGSRARFSGGASGGTPAGAPAAVASRDLAGPVLAAARALSAEARVGVAGRNLTSGERIDIRASEVFPSASVNKVAIMAEVFNQINSGKLVRGAGVDADLERMITLSDNDAANRLMDLVGEQRVNSLMTSNGLSKTVLNNYFSYTRGPLDPGYNQTSPADAATLFSLIANDRLVSPSASQEMRGLLQRVADPSKLLRGVPAGTRVAHKSGWYTGVANDVGIVYTPRGSYVLAVFSEGASDGETGNQLIGAVSRSVYEAWGR